MNEKMTSQKPADNVFLADVVKLEHLVSGYIDGLPCVHYVDATDKEDAIRLALIDFPTFDIYSVDVD